MGSNNASTTWMEVLEQRMNIDVDWMDPDFIKSLPFKPHDQTSNQLWTGMQLQHASNSEALAAAASENPAGGWLSIYTKMAAYMCRKNLDSIQGRVLVQVSPSYAYDKDKVLEHARAYDKEFEKVGVPRDRFCIKILATGPGLNAAKILREEGIATLGTGIFSVEQAIACSQARCLYISPYYNEVRTHQDISLWPNVEDPALEHPFSNRILQMLHCYQQLYKTTGEQQPLIKNAAFRSMKEVVATAELGCHSATMSPTMLETLAQTPYDSTQDPGEGRRKSPDPYKDDGLIASRLRPLLETDPLKSASSPFALPSTTVDYLADNGSALEAALQKDPAGLNRLKDAIAMFVKAEDGSKAQIEAVMRPSSL